MMSLIYYVIYAAFSISDFIPLVKQKKKKDAIAFVIMTILVYALAVFYFSDELRSSFIYNFFKVFKVEI